MNLKLKLRFDPGRHEANSGARPEAVLEGRDAEAWFLTGSDPSLWVEELARCGLAEASTRLFVVITSGEAEDPAGVLVVPAGERISGKRVSGLPCRKLADRLFIPADSVLDPPVTEQEIQQLCPWPVAFFHPTLGLRAFTDGTGLCIWDLLVVPAERGLNWNRARAGEPSLPSLRAVVLSRPPSPEGMFGDAPQNIATDPLGEMPPAPDEPRDGPLSRFGRKLRRRLGRELYRLLRKVPRSSKTRTWINDLQEWARRQVQSVDEQLSNIRNKEVRRLLSLLETDAESGLRHAISLNQFSARGVAPPGARLGERAPDFDLRRLGGGPVDYWSMPFDYEVLLRRRYREMADRELQLGRHRRAAYIYAELLGDLVSAVHALRQGRFFREAAILYEEKLHNPLEAARCLADGGLLSEAIPKYETLGRWLEVADLYEKLGNQPAAVTAIRRVVHAHLEQDDILAAANLVELRLHAPDEAAQLLASAWPRSRQAASCVGALFKLYGRLGRNDAALAHFKALRQGTILSSLAVPLLNAIADLARTYPDSRVRHVAADFSRVLISKQLQCVGTTLEDADRLMSHLVRLSPEDRMLTRDANRYLAERRRAEIQKTRHDRVLTKGKEQLAVVRRFELPRQIEWLQLRSELQWFFALGVTPKRLTLLRGVWDGQYQSLSWECEGTFVKGGAVLFETTADRGTSVALKVFDGRPASTKTFPAADAWFPRPCVVAPPLWLPGLSCTFAGDAVWTIHGAENRRIILACYDKGRTLLRTIDITSDLLGEESARSLAGLRLAALRHGCAVALGKKLLITGPDPALTTLDLPSAALSLCQTPAHTRPGVAVMLEHGAVMYWQGAPNWFELDRDITSPLGAFIPSGPLVIVSRKDGMLLDVDTRGVHSVARFGVDVARPVGVSPTCNPGEFGVLGNRGNIVVYKVPLAT